MARRRPPLADQDAEAEVGAEDGDQEQQLHGQDRLDHGELADVQREGLQQEGADHEAKAQEPDAPFTAYARDSGAWSSLAACLDAHALKHAGQRRCTVPQLPQGHRPSPRAQMLIGGRHEARSLPTAGTQVLFTPRSNGHERGNRVRVGGHTDSNLSLAGVLPGKFPCPALPTMWRFGYVYDTSSAYGSVEGVTRSVTGAAGRKGSVHGTEGEIQPSRVAAPRAAGAGRGGSRHGRPDVDRHRKRRRRQRHPDRRDEDERRHRPLGRASGHPSHLRRPVHRAGAGTARSTTSASSSTSCTGRFTCSGTGARRHDAQLVALARRAARLHTATPRRTITVKQLQVVQRRVGDGQDVVFFMNMLHAEKANWYAYVPGLHPRQHQDRRRSTARPRSRSPSPGGQPELDHLQRARPRSPRCRWHGTSTAAGGRRRIGRLLDGHVRRHGRLTPPARRSGRYLTGQAATSPRGYANNPLWQRRRRSVSRSTRPSWRLVQHLRRGDDGAEPGVLGPQKADVRQFEELPFTTDNAEYNALLGGKLDVGYLPQQDITRPRRTRLKAGPNNPRLVATSTSTPWVLFGFNYCRC